MLGNLEKTATGLALSGVLDYRNGAALRAQGRTLLGACPQPEVVVDCAGVEKASSVGVSLLLCLRRDAQALGKRVQLSNLPRDIEQIAQVCGIAELLHSA